MNFNNFQRKYTKASIEKSEAGHFVFFWGTSKGHNLDTGCFSQWQSVKFSDGIREYQNAEQYMMAQKAILFNDDESLDKILKENNPKSVKQLGRKIKNFNEAIWNENKFRIVLQGNYFKFSNPEFRKVLQNTGDKVIVEASPSDKIWGIGMAKTDSRAVSPNQWNGENLLGFALMEVRDILNKEESQQSV